MAKHTYDHVEFADFETKAQEFISLTFDLSEQELREHRLHCVKATDLKRKALQFTALSVQNSIKAFLAIVQIRSE